MSRSRIGLLSACTSVAVFMTADAFVKTLPTFRAIPRKSAESCHMFRPIVAKDTFSEVGSFPTLVSEMTDNLRRLRQLFEIEEEEAALGMPWTQSIDENTSPDGLLYMPFWEWQMEFLKTSLTNLRVVSCTDHSRSQDFSFRENSEKGARVVNICLASDEYSKIRMTYYDAGDQAQVFTSVWYPNPCFNLPILGMDLLQFNLKKHLAVIDFQPIQEEERLHSNKYEHLLQPIRDQYPSLQGTMSSRFYNQAQFFSNQMLFARFEDSNLVMEELFPAFQSYAKTHVDLVKSAQPNYEDGASILERHADYDSYCAQRDPALSLFASVFNKEWADAFVHEFLFSLSKRPC